MAHIRAHLSDVCRWSTGREIEAAEIFAASLGMAAPILLAGMSGSNDPTSGLTAALGAFAIGRVQIATGFRTHLRRQGQALAAALLAAFLAVICAGHGWLTNAALLLLAGTAAIIGGFSRDMAVATTRVILFLMIMSAVATPAQALGAKGAAGFLILVAGGALWASALDLAFGAIARRHRQVKACASPSHPMPNIHQKYTRWRRSLTSFTGWTYPLRLVLSLAVAMAIDSSWPGHHFHWIGVTAAILTKRQVEPLPVTTTQRALGTALGVAVAASTLHWGLPLRALAGAVGILAGIRPLLRERNYLAYSAMMTPLIILIIDAGRKPDGNLLFDRLVATLIGAGLVIGANFLITKLSVSRCLWAGKSLNRSDI